jgi:nitrite reductase (NADH) small subunit
VTESWIDVGALEEIPRQGARVVKSRLGDIALIRTQDDAVFAIEDRCPHKGGPLSQGIIHGHAVACPLHNWVIDLTRGEAVAPDIGCVKRFGVKVEAGRVHLALPLTIAKAA